RSRMSPLSAMARPLTARMRSRRMSQLLGLQGKYKIQLGTMNIDNVNGLALVTGPYVLKLNGKDVTAESKGALTLLMEKQKGTGWVIAHMHRSIGEIDVSANR